MRRESGRIAAIAQTLRRSLYPFPGRSLEKENHFDLGVQTEIVIAALV